MIRDGFVTIRGFAPGNHSLTSLCNAKKALVRANYHVYLSCNYSLQKWDIHALSMPDTSSTNQSPRITHVKTPMWWVQGWSLTNKFDELKRNDNLMYTPFWLNWPSIHQGLPNPVSTSANDDNEFQCQKYIRQFGDGMMVPHINFFSPILTIIWFWGPCGSL